jgi:hypothetical protein
LADPEKANYKPDVRQDSALKPSGKMVAGQLNASSWPVLLGVSDLASDTPFLWIIADFTRPD